MSDLNDLPRSHDVTDPTTCAWPAQEIAAAEAPAVSYTHLTLPTTPYV